MQGHTYTVTYKLRRALSGKARGGPGGGRVDPSQREVRPEPSPRQTLGHEVAKESRAATTLNE